MPEHSEADSKLLKEIRDNFDYYTDAWASIRKQGEIDMRCISGDAWDPDERKAREDAGRLVLTLDELNQYTNNLINDVRQNKRAIKVSPLGNGATDKTAELRANKIREIERKSNAQAAYTTGFENAVQRSYGCWRVVREYKDERSMDQEIRIRRVPNPDNVLFDPDAKERDCSDGTGAFVKDAIRREDFKRCYPKATVTDFTSEMWGGGTTGSRWLNDDKVQIVEYWKIVKKTRTLILLARGKRPGEALGAGEQPERIFVDELGGAKIDGANVVLPNNVLVGSILQKQDGSLATRESETRKVVQYISNGVEILETSPWDGKYIPLVPCFGKEIYADLGKGPERVLLSMIRLARDPFMLYCYYRTCEAELVGMAPKSVWTGYEGQFEGHEDEWKNANSSPVPYLQVKPMIDPAGGQILPLPVRNTYEPPIQALEVGAESARRGIQAAMGITALPTAAQRQSEKSKIALDKIEEMTSQGSFHFIDNYEMAIEYTGRIIENLLGPTIDSARDEAFVKEDGTRQVLPVMQPVPDPDNPGQTMMHRFDVGDHDVEISTGPSFRTQRQEASETADALLENQMFAPRIGWLAVKLKQLGPIGDQISELITPPDILQKQQQESGQGPDPQQLQAQLRMVQQKLQLALQQLQGRALEKQIETASRERIAALQAYVQVMVQAMKSGDAVAIAAAEQQANRLEAMFDRAHDSALAAQQAQHDQELSAGDQQHQADQAERDRQAAAAQPVATG